MLARGSGHWESTSNGGAFVSVVSDEFWNDARDDPFTRLEDLPRYLLRRTAQNVGEDLGVDLAKQARHLLGSAP